MKKAVTFSLFLIFVLGGIGLFVQDMDRVSPPDNFHVLFIVVDALRADHLGCYGYNRDTSPNIDLFAKDSIAFQNVRSQASCTFPSVNSMLTSIYPFRFLGQEHHRMGVPKSFPYLPAILKRHNYKTMAISASPIVRKNPGDINKHGGYDRGFEKFEELAWKDASVLHKKVFPFIEMTYKPFFLYIHYMDVHCPYDPPRGYSKYATDYLSEKNFIHQRTLNDIENMIYSSGPHVDVTDADIGYMIDLYDDEIAYFDNQFQNLLDLLKRERKLPYTLVVISADHGEEFLEHNSVKHCHTLYDTEIKVPLIMKIPNLTSKGPRYALVQNLDIVPTILDYLGLEDYSYDFEGSSLKPVIESDQRINDYVFSTQNSLREVNDDSHKLIYDIETQESLLFDICNDIHENNNIFERQTTIGQELKQKVMDWSASIEGQDLEERITKGKNIQDQLHSLGYLQ